MRAIIKEITPNSNQVFTPNNFEADKSAYYFCDLALDTCQAGYQQLTILLDNNSTNEVTLAEIETKIDDFFKDNRLQTPQQIANTINHILKLAVGQHGFPSCACYLVDHIFHIDRL